MDPFNPNATHQNALAWAVSKTRGPVVEMGIGWYSTWMLHGLTEGMGRELYSVEPHEEWIAPFRVMESELHHLVLDPSLTIPIEKAGVIFIDHNDAFTTRAEVIREAADIADLVVIHDSEPGKEEFYPGVFTCFVGMEPAINEYKHRRDWRDMFPWTTAVWNDDRRKWPRSTCPACGGENLSARVYEINDPHLSCLDCGTRS